MTQLEDPANLARWDDPARRLITLILIRCGLRITDGVQLPFDCVICDADGAPFLRYYNHKMEREAVVPIDEELHRMIGEQQRAVIQRWSAPKPYLFPRPTANLEGEKPMSGSAYRAGLYRWLEECDIRDAHGQPVKLTPHQLRHTGRGVSCKAAAGQGNPGASQRLLLPAGSQDLPACKRLTCPMFLTTAEFLPQHISHRSQVLQIISAAEAQGHARVAEMNRQVAGNLDKIITAFGGEKPDHPEGAAADAS